MEGTLMPSTSPKQKRFMAAAAHDAQFAKEAGISQKVAKEFNRADKRRAVVKGAIKKVRGG
jgi:hypothetical protein